MVSSGFFLCDIGAEDPPGTKGMKPTGQGLWQVSEHAPISC